MPAQMSLNGHALVHDSRSGRWLCTWPDSCFGSDCEARVSIAAGSGWSDIAIDGTPVSDGESVWFSSLDGTTAHSLHAQVGDSVIDVVLEFSCLPLLEVTAALSASYSAGTFVLHHPDSVSPQHLQGRIKWRGRTTLSGDRHKRNFHIKLEDEHGEKLNQKLLGLRDDNSWILDGGQTDLSRIRNHVAHELWMDMATPPYYADREPKARTGSRGELIELFVNGQYEGVYTLMEPIDRKQLKLRRYECDSDNVVTIHGQLWKAIVYGKGTAFNDTIHVDNSSETWFGFETKYPNFEEVNPTDYGILADAITFTAKAYDSRWRRGCADYFDLPVMRDYNIFLQVLLGIDNCNKNVYWAVYDKQEDKRLTLAVWDLDCTVGQDWTNNPFRPENRVGPERDFMVGNNVLFRLRVLLANFNDDMIARYHELRKGVLHTDSITQRYLSHIDQLIHAGAAARESDRWDCDSDLGGHSLDWEAEKAYIANWLKRRLHYLDTHNFALAGIDGVMEDAAPDDGVTYDLLGRPMPADRTLPPGIYVRSGKKIVVQ